MSGSGMGGDDRDQIWDLIIIGAGPAGMACAIYAGRGRLKTLILEGLMAGGQVVLNEVIENYPGFPEGILGFQLGQLMSQQAARFGAETEAANVQNIDVLTSPFTVHTTAGERRAKAVLVATGSAPKKLGIPGEKEYFTRGVSYCATCDGPLYSDKRLMVVGGGNTALEEAIFLSGLAREVTLVHRREQLRADKILQERALANGKIKFLWNHLPVEVLGDEVVTGVRVRHVQTEAEQVVPTDGLFIAIGNAPRSDFLPPQIERDETGLVFTDRHLQTSVPGIFAAGDVRRDSYRQIAFAVGDGTLAYRGLLRWLEEEAAIGGA
jgi:thioredoxin reductase (NADPH)